MNGHVITIPKGRFRVTTDDSAAAAQRRRIAERIRNGEAVSINAGGTLHAPGQTVEMASGMGGAGHVTGDVELVVPTGKLATR